MLVRALLMLAILLQPLGLATPGPVRGGCDCVQGTCCTPVERTNCCGEPTIETVCHRSGGECRCGVDDRREDAPTSPATPPTTDREVLSWVLIAPVELVAFGADDLTLTRQPTGTASERFAGLTHNEIQALLGIWRT